ncbi:MAG: response regulator transcription factor [Actinomycetota bacterium]|nr:response regulator transcription factor [Actinomycetota bacterium]
MSTPTRALVVGGHPVILGVVRLACGALPDVEIVAEASDGPAAVAAASSLTPDLAVVDLDLPGTDGVDVLRSLRDTGYGGRIVVVSERADGATVLDAMRLGVDAYLTKPDGLRRIGDAIRRVLDGERVIDPALEQAAVLELGRFARQARESSEVDASFTPREREILELLAEGLTMQQIGRRLDISPRTVETHVANLYRKLAVRSRVQAVSRAASLGLIELR